MDLDISWSTHTNKRGSEVDIPMLMASSRPQVDLDISWSTHTNKRGSEVDIPMLMASCPHFAEMARGLQGYLKSWNDVHRAAAQLRPMAGISEDAWNVAQKVMGPGVAAAAIALIFDKHTDGEVKSPGGYYGNSSVILEFSPNTVYINDIY